MKILRVIYNYLFCCGIEKNKYDELKSDVYISNYRVWRKLHYLMAAVFGLLFFSSLFNEFMSVNTVFYLVALIYSLIAIVLFFFVEKDSLTAQIIIYISISFLLLFGCFITQNKPDLPAATFVVFLLITPMFVIDRAFFMALELITASVLFLIWMHAIKPFPIWQLDVLNCVTYTIVGIVLNIIASSIRIKEFVLTREINIQKDTDDMTGLCNKGSLTRKINEYLEDGNNEKGIMFLLDVDHFKEINDTYGHDIGDDVIEQLGVFLGERFKDEEIVGRFGGDEFILFVKDTKEPEIANKIATDIYTGASEFVTLPDEDRKICISIGIAIYEGNENNYSEIFKKADIALYRAKADASTRFCIYE